MNSKGKYIAFLDDDDVWFNEKLSKQVEMIENNNKIGFVLCNIEMYDPIKKQSEELNITLKGSIFIELLKMRSGLNTSILLIKRDLLIESGGFDENLPSYQDYDLLLKLSLLSECDTINEKLVAYKKDSDSISYNPKAKLEGLERLLFKYKNYYDYYGLKKSLSLIYYSLASLATKCNKNSSLRYYTLSIKYNPYNIKPYIKFFITIFFFLGIFRKHKAEG